MQNRRNRIVARPPHTDRHAGSRNGVNAGQDGLREAVYEAGAEDNLSVVAVEVTVQHVA
jgi:hypothetical protein